MYLWDQVFSPLKINNPLEMVEFERSQKQATQMQIIYILDSGLDSGLIQFYILDPGLDLGLIQFIYWIRALIVV